MTPSPTRDADADRGAAELDELDLTDASALQLLMDMLQCWEQQVITLSLWGNPAITDPWPILRQVWVAHCCPPPSHPLWRGAKYRGESNPHDFPLALSTLSPHRYSDSRTCGPCGSMTALATRRRACALCTPVRYQSCFQTCKSWTVASPKSSVLFAQGVSPVHSTALTLLFHRIAGLCAWLRILFLGVFCTCVCLGVFNLCVHSWGAWALLFLARDVEVPPVSSTTTDEQLVSELCTIQALDLSDRHIYQVRPEKW